MCLHCIKTVTSFCDVFFLDDEPDGIQLTDTKNLAMNVNSIALPTVTVIIFMNMMITTKATVTAAPTIIFIDVFFVFFFFPLAAASKNANKWF